MLRAIYNASEIRQLGVHYQAIRHSGTARLHLSYAGTVRK